MINKKIAEELAVKISQVEAAVALLDEGATVPFISRYRKEVTGGLDDIQLRLLEERLRYLRELEDRRDAILKSIAEQEKLTPELEQKIKQAETKNRLEDLYLPYKKKRITKAQIARDAGLEPLADSLLNEPNLLPEFEAEKYVNKEKGVEDIKAALDGAKQILMERFAENADLLEKLREFMKNESLLISKVYDGKEKEAEKFRDYFDFSEALHKVPSHRALAMFRGRNENFLTLSLGLEGVDSTDMHPCELTIAKFWGIEDLGRSADAWLKEVVRWTWRVKLLTHIETDLLGQLRERAETSAIDVFAANLKDLLLAAPAGQKATIGLDPGLRTGVKVAVLDATGKVLDHGAIFPTAPQHKTAEAEAKLLAWITKYNIELIAIGNGTASRETDKFVGDVFKNHPEIKVQKIIVNESGASVFSASEYAAKEMPDLDVTIRGAVSIARRLQDPLAELVKIEPKSIGVGQYQHDVSQTALARQLDAVVEDCVNGVGVDLNTASVPLLARVSGLNSTIATNIVALRDEQGAFKNRQQLLSVKRLGDKAFEQAAGFLRIANGENPLDASGVHPESYQVVEKIVNDTGKDIRALMGDSACLKALNAADYADQKFGIPTVTDILQELDKPGRDPRPEFKMAQLKDGVETLKDLGEGMILEGTVTNVTNFGAFVDIGVHQDGLVHISMLADTFVKDPREVVKAGQIVKVKVVEVDIPRKRIALSMRLHDEPGDQQAVKPQAKPKNRPASSKQQPRSDKSSKQANKPKSGANNAFAQAFAKAKKTK